MKPVISVANVTESDLAEPDINPRVIEVAKAASDLQYGVTAPQAAGVIHSDFQKGFIRVETVSYDDFVAAGSLGVAREKGLC
uniref:YchF C-terminal domain-containing protein n=1 Tax=Zea mays TaxID=4577 RepID=A0A804PQV0_MAIZE